MIARQIEKFIEGYELKEPFIVAFSGGYDSMCLLDALCKTGYKPIAIHLNHKWRGEESDSEEANCRKFAKSKGIEFYSENLSSDIPKTETAARDARYKFFEKCAKKFKSNVVFTAHNFDDNAETVIYRIIKGTGTIGLQGIAPNRDIFYRPLLKIKREDIEKYCSDNNLKPNKDSSNDNTKYKRNLIRKKIIPLMKEINPNIIDAVNSLSDIAKEDFEQKNDKKYFVRELLKSKGLDYDRKKIEEICQFISENKNSKSGKKMSLTKDLWLYTNNKETEIIEREKKSNKSINIKSTGKFRFDKYIFEIEPYNKINFQFPKDNEYKAIVNLDSINFTLRYRKNGDIIQPYGLEGTQKLKKYLNEKKIPQHKKDSIVLLCSENEVLWAAGLGINDKIKVKNKPTHIIKLKRINENE